MSTASWDDFTKIAIVAGTIVRVEEFPQARKPAYKLWVDLGAQWGVRCSSAQITALYNKEELVGKQVVCVANFPSKNIAGFTSELLVTGFYRDDSNVVLAVPDKAIPNGAKLG